MAKVFPGRFTAQTDDPFVVFLIGMRINKYLAVNKWLPVAQAMGPMLQTLYQNPEKGFLGGEFYFSLRGPLLLQYWRSFEDLEQFARSPQEPHLSAWKRFNNAVGADGSVGIWHETYVIEAGNYEGIYGNMPLFGLAKATKHVEAIGRRHTARRRLNKGESEIIVPDDSPVVS